VRQSNNTHLSCRDTVKRGIGYIQYGSIKLDVEKARRVYASEQDSA